LQSTCFLWGVQNFQTKMRFVLCALFCLFVLRGNITLAATEFFYVFEVSIPYFCYHHVFCFDICILNGSFDLMEAGITHSATFNKTQVIWLITETRLSKMHLTPLPLLHSPLPVQKTSLHIYFCTPCVPWLFFLERMCLNSFNFACRFSSIFFICYLFCFSLKFLIYAINLLSNGHHIDIAI
jgi:hypothetical protein